MCLCFFAYAQEVKIRACRVIMKFLLIIGCFLAYYIAWGFCDRCILIVTVASCGGTWVGMGFLGPSCYAGILASLLRGFRLGSEMAHVDIQWKI